CHHTYGPPRTF
nr:immunoglobulin light chain junction region [Macaca mulatta]